MADEYINKQAFNDAIREAVRRYPNTFYNGLEVARQIAHDMDAADVVPVVRCKDCRHIHIGKDVYYCRYWERWGITPNGFCSSVAKMDGKEKPTTVETNLYDEEVIYPNCTVQVWRNSHTGEESWGWWKNE